MSVLIESRTDQSSATVVPAEVPFISVVIPVLDEAQHIGRVLDQLFDQDYDPARFEILVVDGQSTDGTREKVSAAAQGHPNLRLLENPRRLSSAARNVGVRAARGEFVVIIDGHCDLESRQLLTNIAVAFRQSGADCLGRPQPLDAAPATPLQQAIAAARRSPLGHHPDSFIYSTREQYVPAASVAVAYRRSVFDRVGYFDEQFDACEDVEFNYRVDRAGLRCYFTPAIAVHYRPRESLAALFRQLARYGRGRGRLLRKHPETASVGSVLPALFVLGLVPGPSLCLLHAWLTPLYLVSVMLYALTVLAASLAIAVRHRKLAMLSRLPWVFLTIHMACGVGLLSEVALRFKGPRVPDDSRALQNRG